MKRIIYTTPQEAEAAFYEAFEKRDLDAMMNVWADDEEIVCVHPGGARLTGIEQVRDSWRRIFAAGQRLRFRLRALSAINGVPLAVHSVYEQITVEGESRLPAPVIATNVYMRTGDGWRMVVHHGSAAPAQAASESKPAPKTLH